MRCAPALLKVSTVQLAPSSERPAATQSVLPSIPATYPSSETDIFRTSEAMRCFLPGWMTLSVLRRCGEPELIGPSLRRGPRRTPLAMRDTPGSLPSTLHSTGAPGERRPCRTHPARDTCCAYVLYRVMRALSASGGDGSCARPDRPRGRRGALWGLRRCGYRPPGPGAEAFDQQPDGDDHLPDGDGQDEQVLPGDRFVAEQRHQASGPDQERPSHAPGRQPSRNES